ncbi:MAG: hypothetical protein ACRC8S_06805 [Fimbriiglobus sp.]
MARIFRWQWLKKWLKRTALAGFFLFVVIPFLARMIFVQVEQSRREAIVNRLNETQPGWQLKDLQEAYNAQLPPPERNAYVIADRAAKMLPENITFLQLFVDLGDKVPSNRLRSEDDRVLLAKLFEDTKEGRNAAQALLNIREQGGQEVTIFGKRLPPGLASMNELKTLEYLFSTEAILAAEDGKVELAMKNLELRDTMSRYAISPSYPSEYYIFLHSGFVSRNAYIIRDLINVSKAPLPWRGLHTRLLQDSQRDSFGSWLEICRANKVALLSAIDENRFDEEDFPTHSLPVKSSWWIRPLLYKSWTYELEMHERLEKIKTAPARETLPQLIELRNEKRGNLLYIYTNAFGTGLDKGYVAIRNSQALLRAAALGILCEEFRLANGRWPRSLEELPKAQLPKIPLDPYTDQPMLYKILEDRIVIYSQGTNFQDDGGNLSSPRSYEEPRDIGISLYHPAFRRQPARLPKAAVEDEIPQP